MPITTQSHMVHIWLLNWKTAFNIIIIICNNEKIIRFSGLVHPYMLKLKGGF